MRDSHGFVFDEHNRTHSFNVAINECTDIASNNDDSQLSRWQVIWNDVKPSRLFSFVVSNTSMNGWFCVIAVVEAVVVSAAVPYFNTNVFWKWLIIDLRISTLPWKLQRYNECANITTLAFLPSLPLNDDIFKLFNDWYVALPSAVFIAWICVVPRVVIFSSSLI